LQPRADRPGLHEPLDERRAGGRRTGGNPPEDVCGQWQRVRRGERQRPGHRAGAVRARFRALLHDEGGRPRNRARARHRPLAGGPPRGRYPAAERAGEGCHLRRPAPRRSPPGGPGEHMTVAEPAAALLVVDDETPVLALVPQLFQGEFPVLTARSGEEALARLAEAEVGVVIADQRMPGMAGTELLARGAEEKPDVVRFGVTGYADA